MERGRGETGKAKGSDAGNGGSEEEGMTRKTQRMKRRSVSDWSRWERMLEEEKQKEAGGSRSREK